MKQPGVERDLNDYRLDWCGLRIRARTAGRWLVDSVDTWLFYEPGRHPVYAVPRSALPALNLEEALLDDDGRTWARVAEGNPTRTVRVWPEATTSDHRLISLAGLPVEFADEWYEEDQPLLGAPTDPYRRVDVYRSSREVVIMVAGHELARTTRPRLVRENGMPSVWYVPIIDVASEYLRSTSTRTTCQYKGRAEYFDLDVAGQLIGQGAWTYHGAWPEFADHLAFEPWHSKITTLVDGEKSTYQSPTSSWSNPSSELAVYR